MKKSRVVYHRIQKLRCTTTVIFSFLFFILPTVTLAQKDEKMRLLNLVADNTGLGNTAVATPEQGITNIVGKVLQSVLLFSGIVFIILMLSAGFLWLTSAGSSKQIDKAKHMITTSIIGVVVVAFAYLIVSFVLSFLK